MNAEKKSAEGRTRRPPGKYTRRTRGWDRFWQWERPVAYLVDGAMRVTLTWENWDRKSGTPTIELRAEVGSRGKGRRSVYFTEPTSDTLNPADAAELRARYVEAFMLARKWTNEALSRGALARGAAA